MKSKSKEFIVVKLLQTIALVLVGYFIYYGFRFAFGMSYITNLYLAGATVIAAVIVLITTWIGKYPVALVASMIQTALVVMKYLETMIRGYWRGFMVEHIILSAATIVLSIILVVASKRNRKVIANNAMSEPVNTQAYTTSNAVPNSTAQTATAASADQPGSNASGRSEEILKVVKTAVGAQLKSPASAQFPSELLSVIGDDARGYHVTGFVDSQNSYGAMLRNDFTVDLAIENGFPVAKSVVVGKAANAQRAKAFGVNYIILSIATLAIAAISYFVMKSMIGF